MLYGGVAGGGLELRRLDGGGARLTGRFPYNQPTELAPGRFEVIAPRAFAASLAQGAGIYLLAGHDFDRPLASRAAGTLELTDSDEALTFEATISDATTWARDFLAAHGAGLIRGLSPGFRVAGGGDRIERDGTTIRRTVFAAELVELSAVARPAYDHAQVEARRWTAQSPDLNRIVMRANHAYRWR
ncbi:MULTISPECIES: HK97 family phage prohead protease [unclassified Mameliella]|uniref:HK97 family phage prohead protease n=1 Tax=unclassified Mameliella TaxID=2630630 RepID=UPI00273F43D3|nr:HK97 family phage prohead protease [Mameliella sp. MMSF_3455]